MTKETDRIVQNILALVITAIFGVMGWLGTITMIDIKDEIKIVGKTLENMRSDVSKLNNKALLQEQEFKFKFEWIQKNDSAVKARLNALESNIKSH